MKNQITKLFVLGCGMVSLAGNAVAGGKDVVRSENDDAQAGDWCVTLGEVGKVFEDEDHPFIQELEFFGRMHLQYAYVDGEDALGREYSADFEEIRRLRFGTKVEFLHGFKLKANVNLIDDQRPAGGDRDWGYDGFDELWLTYTWKDVFGFDELEVGYGRYKVAVGAEGHTSSRNIKTVERSALSNKMWDGRYTALLISAERDTWTGTVGLLSLEVSDVLAGWGGGEAVYASTAFEGLGGEILLDVLYNFSADDSGDDEIEVGYEWVTSAAWEGDIGGGWKLMVNLALGENGDEDYTGREGDGLFYGGVIMPSRDLIEDQLEFVVRYQWQGAESDNGIRLNSRYVRRAEDAKGLDLGRGGRGDRHHSIYAGLNWFQCGHHSKVMTGVEYERISTDEGSADSTTFWMAYRFHF